MKTLHIFFRAVALVCLLFALPSILGATSWYVKPDAPSGAMGSSWANACTLGDALVANKTKAGDTIRLHTGDYFPIGNTHYKIGHSLTLIGGETEPGEVPGSTVLDGLGSSRFFHITTSATNTAVHLQNMILQNCNASTTGQTSEHGYGGAIYNGSSTLTLTDVSIHSCVATSTKDASGYGGAIFSEGGIVVLKGKTLIYNNIASKEGSGYGGAIAVKNNPEIEYHDDVEVHNNKASISATAAEALGGAFYLNGIAVSSTLHLYRAKIHHNYALGITGESTAKIEAGAIYGAGNSHIEFHNIPNSILIYDNEAVLGASLTGERAIYPDSTKTVRLPRQLQAPVGSYGSAKVSLDLGDREFGYYEVQNGKSVSVDLSIEKPFDYIYPYIGGYSSTTDISPAPDKKIFRLSIAATGNIDLSESLQFRYCVLKLPDTIPGNGLWIHKGVAYSPLGNFLASPGNNFRDPNEVKGDSIRLVAYPPIHPHATPALNFRYTDNAVWIKLPSTAKETTLDSTVWHFPLAQLAQLGSGSFDLKDKVISFQFLPYDPATTAVIAFDSIRIQGMFYKSRFGKTSKMDTLFARNGTIDSFAIEADYEFKSGFPVQWMKNNDPSTTEFLPSKEPSGNTFNYGINVTTGGSYRIDPNAQDEMTSISLSAFTSSISGSTIANYYGIGSKLSIRAYNGYYLGLDNLEAHYDTNYGILAKYNVPTAGTTPSLYYPSTRTLDKSFKDTFAIIVDEPAAHIPLTGNASNNPSVWSVNNNVNKKEVIEYVGAEDIIGESGARKAVRHIFAFQPKALLSDEYTFTPTFAYDLIFLPEQLPSGFVYSDGLTPGGVHLVPLKQQGAADTLRIYPSGNYESGVPQTVDPPISVPLKYHMPGGTTSAVTDLPISYTKHESVLKILVPAGGYSGKGAHPVESPKMLSEMVIGSNTSTHTLSVDQMYSLFTFKTPGLSPGGSYPFKGLLGQSFIVSSDDISHFPIAFQDGNRAIPITKKSNLDYYFSAVVVMDDNARLSVINLNLYSVINQYKEKYKFDDFNYDTRRGTYYITAKPNPGYEYLTPGEVNTSYYSTKVYRRGETNVYDIHFSFNQFIGTPPLEITPDFPLLEYHINLTIDPRFSVSDAFSFLSKDGFINDTIFLNPVPYTRRFIVVAQGANRFLTPVIRCNKPNAINFDEKVAEKSVPGTDTDGKVFYYYTITANESVDVLVTASPFIYTSLPDLLNFKGFQYILPSKTGEGFYIDERALKTPDLINIYVRTDARATPKAFLFTITGTVDELKELSDDNYKTWKINFYSSNIPNISGEYPLTIFMNNISLIYLTLPPEIAYLKKDNSNAFVIDYDKAGPTFLLEVDGVYDSDTFTLFLGKPYDNLSPKVTLEPIPGYTLQGGEIVKEIETAPTSVKIGGNSWREGIRHQYEVKLQANAILRITLPPYHAVTLPEAGELPPELTYGSSVTSGASLYEEGRTVSIPFLIRKDYAAVSRPVIKLNDGTLLTLSEPTDDGQGNLAYKASFLMPDHDVTLICTTEYNSLTFPATPLPAPLKYVEGYKGAVDTTYFYPAALYTLDTVTLLVEDTNEPPPFVSVLDNPHPNSTVFYPDPSLTLPGDGGGTIYRYPIRFSGRRTLFISRVSVLQDTILLPSLPQGRLEYANGSSEERQVIAKPGELVSFSVRPVGLYSRASPLVTLNGRTLAPVISDEGVYTFSFVVPAVPSSGRNPVKLQPEIGLDYFTVEFTNLPLPPGVNFHESSNLRGPKNYLYRAFGHDLRDTFVLVVDSFYSAILPECAITIDGNSVSENATRTEGTSVGIVYRYAVSLPYDKPNASVTVNFSPVTHVWAPLPEGIVYGTLPDGLTPDAAVHGGVSCYKKEQEVSFTLRTSNPYTDVAPIVHRNGYFVARTYLGAGEYRYTFTAEEDASFSFFLPYRVITLPALGAGATEGLHYVGLPADGPHYVSPNSDIPFLFSLRLDENHTDAFLPRVFANGIDLKPESVNGYTFIYSLKTSVDVSPFISLTSLAVTLSLPVLPQGLTYDGESIPGESQHIRTIHKTFTLLVAPEYRAVKPLVFANGTSIEPGHFNFDGSAYTYTIDADVNTIVSVAFDYYAVTLPPNLPVGVSYPFGSLEAGTYFRAAGDIFSFTLRTPADNNEPPTVYCNGSFVPGRQRASGLFDYTFTVTGNTTVLIAYNNLVLFIGIESPELAIASDKGQGVHYYPLTGIHEIFVLEVDPEYAGLTPVLTINGKQQTAAYVQGNRFTYNLNSGGSLEVHASLHYNTFILRQVPPDYLLLLPAADTYYRDAGVPFQFHVQDYLNLGDPSVTYDGQTLAPVSHEEDDYEYILNPKEGTKAYSIRVASKLSNTTLSPLQVKPSVSHHSSALHLSHLAGRPLVLVDAAGRLFLRILPSSDDYVYPISLPQGIYFLISPAYKGAQSVAFKFVVH
jgi:hypothetical protein